MDKQILNNTGLDPMNREEMQECNGGVLIGYFLNGKFVEATAAFAQGFLTCFVEGVVEKKLS